MANNRFIHAQYKLYDVTDSAHDLLEETTADRPFVFISGMGLMLEAFEKQLEGLENGAEFRFTLRPEEAYGEFNEKMVQPLDKELFCVDGKFDADNVYEDAVIPLQNEEGQRFMGRVAEVTDSQVVIDLNHPLAGRTLCFEGRVVENHEATAQEMQQLVEHLTGHGKGCHCGGHCGGKHDGKHDCKHGGEHGDGECCGKHGHGDCDGHGHGDGECCGNCKD